MRRTLAAFAATLLLASTGAIRPAGAAHPLRLTVGTLGSIGSLDPRHGFSTIAKEVWNLQYPTLTSLDPQTLDPAPGLASGWRPAPAGKGWIYSLPPGLKWSDGQRVTADDVVYSLNDARREHWRSVTDAFTGLTARALSPRSVEVERSDGAGSGFLPGLLLHVVPAHVFSNTGDLDADVAKLGVSDGAWHVTTKSAGSVELDAVSGTTGPALQQIVFRTYPNASALIDALAHKQVDVVSGLPDPDIARLESLSGVTVDHAGDGTQYVLRDNLTDARTRTAISLAIDRTALVADTFHGVGTPGVVPIVARGNTWALDDATVQSLNASLDAQPERARRLLAEALAIRRPLTIQTQTGDSTGQRVVAFVRRALASVGIATAAVGTTPVQSVSPDLVVERHGYTDDPFPALGDLECNACSRLPSGSHDPPGDFSTLVSIAHSKLEQLTKQAKVVGLFEPDTLQAFRSDNIAGWLREPQQSTLVVFGPTVSQYGSLVAAPPPLREQLSNTSYVVGAVVVLALCGAAFASAVWIRRRYVLPKENHAG